MDELARWLDERSPGMPPELRQAVDVALATSGAGDTGTLPERLAEAALATLARVARAEPERSTADELLAADTLLTYACEAAAEAGPAALDRLTAELGYARFATFLEPTRS